MTARNYFVGRRWAELSEAEKAEIAELYRSGVKLSAIARRFGTTHDILKAKIDPEWAEMRRLRQTAAISVRVAREAEASWRAKCVTIPDDTRTTTGRLCGDPLPGRSALDRDRHSSWG